MGKGFRNTDNSGIMNNMEPAIQEPIEIRHPAEIFHGYKELTQRQRELLNKLPEYASQIVTRKHDVSMLDLSSLTAETGDEFAMFTRKGERLIIRGDNKQIPLEPKDIISLHENGYRWSGHTHPGNSEVDLIASDGDKLALELFGQNNSVIYNAVGKNKLIYPEDE
jgi:hypothetical protein